MNDFALVPISKIFYLAREGEEQNSEMRPQLNIIKNKR